MTVVVVKIGSSSVTTTSGTVNGHLLSSIARQVAVLRASGTDVVLVTSGAVALGWSTLAQGAERPKDTVVLQAASAVGQHRLMAAWEAALGAEGIICGQVLLNSLDFGHRQQYLHARRTLEQLRQLGVVPIVNENDATSDSELRFGDNDRMAALVAQLVGADHLVLLTDTEGLYTADPRVDADASLISVVREIDEALERAATGTQSTVGSGGMASKLAAAKMATFSGITATIAEAERINVVSDALNGVAGVGTKFVAGERTLSSRKLWIAFALTPQGVLHIDEGAAKAIREGGRSLLAAGVTAVDGSFVAGDPVEVHDENGLVAKGLINVAASDAQTWIGRRSNDLPPSIAAEVIHRDDLVVLG